MKVRSAIFAPVLFGSVLILAGFSSRLITWMGEISEDPFLSVAIIQLLVFLLPVSFYCGLRGMNFANALKVRTVAVKKLPFLTVMLVLMFLVMLLLRYFGLFWFGGAMVDTPSAIYLAIPAESTILMILCEVILPAMLEEVVFRGILLEEYLPYGKGFAVVMTALMFAMIHTDPANLFFYFCLGLIYGIVTVVSDSLLPAVLFHILCNLSYFYLRPAAVEYTRQAGKSPLFPYLVIAAVLLFVVLALSRLEDLYRSRSYDEMLQSRKELLRQEAEKNKPQEDEPRRKNLFLNLREVYLSPTFLAMTAVYVLFAVHIL